MGKGSQFPHLRHDRDVADFAIFLVAPVKSRLNFVGSCLAPPNRMDTEDPIRVNCGGCGRPMLLTIEALRELKTVDLYGLCNDSPPRRSPRLRQVGIRAHFAFQYATYPAAVPGRRSRQAPPSELASVRSPRPGDASTPGLPDRPVADRSGLSFRLLSGGGSPVRRRRDHFRPVSWP